MTNRTAIARRRDPIGSYRRMQARTMARRRQGHHDGITSNERHATFLILEGLRRKR